ncbi:MAG: hypothetical protein FJ399_10465 [Verrucomicrobia bacterium]|nr:hypothetical protein [Verrucomicrobiota bacterium]
MLLVLATTGYVGLGSMLAGGALIPCALWFAPADHRAEWTAAAAVTAAFILFTHRSNVRRLLAGTEHRFERARILARLVGK